jgi:16S rRNA (cytidine1402-2'-O)-methyltransferase
MLYLVATPIGNLEDVSARALAVLRETDVLACEDTRRTRKLLTRHELPKPGVVLSYREGNEERVGEQIVRFLGEGKTVTVCSDGGYPGISDPGYRLVRLAVDRDLEFEVIPGPSAVPVALLLSGLPTSSYTFKGYPPRKPGARRRFFEEENDRPHTLVVFESPFRAHKALEAALAALGDRQAAVCIELTKKFERVSRGYLSDLVAQFDGQTVKGEVTIVIAGNNPKFRRA